MIIGSVLNFATVNTVNFSKLRIKYFGKSSKDEHAILPQNEFQKYNQSLGSAHFKTLKKSEDIWSSKFIKIVKTIVTFGIKYDELWKTKADSFIEQSSPIASPKSTRKRKADELASPDKKPR